MGTDEHPTDDATEGSADAGRNPGSVAQDASDANAAPDAEAASADAATDADAVAGPEAASMGSINPGAASHESIAPDGEGVNPGMPTKPTFTVRLSSKTLFDLSIARYTEQRRSV